MPWTLGAGVLCLLALPQLLGADPEFQKLTLPNPAPPDSFGNSVAMSGDTALITAQWRDNFSGAAFIYESGPGGLSPAATLNPSDRTAFGEFGPASAIDGDTAVVTARSTVGNPQQGAAHVFERDHGGSGNWGETQKLTFGCSTNWRCADSVAISGDALIVGGVKYPSNGAAWVFERGVSGWSQVAQLVAPADGSTSGHQFGRSVAISGDVAVVGAYRDFVTPPGSPRLSNSGAAYVYERNTGGPSNWGLVTQIYPADLAANDGFGYSVAMSGGTIFATSRNERATYVFEKVGGSWTEIAKLTTSGGGLALSVAATDHKVLVGEGTPTAHVFFKPVGGWASANVEDMQLTASDGIHMGQAVAVAGDVALVGAPASGGATYVYTGVSAIPPNTPPTILFAGLDPGQPTNSNGNVECTGDSCALVGLSASASDADGGDTLTYSWTLAVGGAEVASGTNVQIKLPVGTTDLVLLVSDGVNEAVSAPVTVTVEDTTAPTVAEASPSRAHLWPPNHKMIDVAVSVDVSDVCDASVDESSCRIVSVSSNEAENGDGDGDTSPDWVITDDLTVELRAERSGRGSDRIYTITVECADGAGHVAVEQVEVAVPHRRPR